MTENDIAAHPEFKLARELGVDLDAVPSSEEMQGGTFTFTNFGAIGGGYATPIINHLRSPSSASVPSRPAHMSSSGRPSRSP